MKYTDNIDPRILEAIDTQDELGGIEIKKLPPGTIILAETRNSIYEIEILEKGVEIQGGKYFPKPTSIPFHGSTWGGSMLKVGWIGYDMHMEMGHPTEPAKYITTTRVKRARIIGPDWEYPLEWPEG
jgi:hypothetical protein